MNKELTEKQCEDDIVIAKKNNQGGEACFNIVREEYLHTFNRSDKLDNKIYISLTFYAFIFAFMMGLIDNICKFKFPTNNVQLILIIFYVVFIIIVIGLFIYTLIRLVEMLKPLEIKTFNQDFIVKNSVQHNDPNGIYVFAVVEYTKAINYNNNNLEIRFKEYKKCLTNITWIVVLSFILNIANMFIVKGGG